MHFNAVPSGLSCLTKILVISSDTVPLLESILPRQRRGARKLTMVTRIKELDCRNAVARSWFVPSVKEGIASHDVQNDCNSL